MEKCKLHVRVFEAGDILVKQKENDSPHVILPRSLFHNFQGSHGALGGGRIGVEYSSAEWTISPHECQFVVVAVFLL